MTKRMLADVLWKAANERLLPDGEAVKEGRLERYSCCALALAINPETDSLPPKVEKWVAQLGCNPNADGFCESFDLARDRQGARYMWLLLAMHVAEDEGIELS